MYCTNCGESINDHAEICVKCGVRQYREKHYCYNCGSALNQNQEVCLQCGVNVQEKFLTTSRKIKNKNSSLSPGISAVLSFLVTGLGQMILGQVKKGVLMFFGGVLLSLLTGGVLAPVIWIVSAVDGYLIAKKINEGKVVSEWEFF